MKAQTAFERFHNQNPHVYRKLVALARRVKSAGHTKYSIWSLFAVLRWHSDIETKGESYKLSNNHTSRYARLIMAQESDLKGFFNTKPLRAA